MATTKRNDLLRWAACVLAAMLVLGTLAGCGGGDEEPPADPNAATEETVDSSETPAIEQASADPLAAAADLFREPSAKLQNLVNAAKTWDPLFRPWWGKIAPDFTLTDVDGNVHKLSDYRGKNVVVLIWRTTNATCKLEVPQLNELRGAFPDKDLAILTVSNEDAARLKAFADEQGATFTVLTGSSLPAPFSDVQYAPGSFFVGPEGRFKLAARGFITAADAKAIVQVQ